MAKRFKHNDVDVLVLRACAEDMTSREDFKYPRRGHVADRPGQFVRNSACGNGLHGWLWGYGDPGLVPSYAWPRGKWLVIRVKSADICNLTGKVKFPEGRVVFCGTKREAGKYLRDRRPEGAWYEHGNHRQIAPGGGRKF